MSKTTKTSNSKITTKSNLIDNSNLIYNSENLNNKVTNTVTNTKVTKLPKGGEMPDMFYGIQQYFAKKALMWVLENYNIEDKDNPDQQLDLSYFMGMYNAAIKAEQFEPKAKTKRKTHKKELTEEEKENKKKKRCSAGKNPNKDGIIDQCGMSKMKNPGEDDNPDFCANHNRALANGKDVITFDPAIHGPDNPNFKPKDKPKGRGKGKGKKSEEKKTDPVTELVNDMQSDNSKDNSPLIDDLDNFVEESRKKRSKSNTSKVSSKSKTSSKSTVSKTSSVSKKSNKSNVGCPFVYSRKTGDRLAGDTCGLVNCHFAAHKKLNAQKTNIPLNTDSDNEEDKEVNFSKGEADSDNELEGSDKEVNFSDNEGDKSDNEEDNSDNEEEEDGSDNELEGSDNEGETEPRIVEVIDIEINGKKLKGHVDTTNLVYIKNKGKFEVVGEVNEGGSFETF